MNKRLLRLLLCPNRIQILNSINCSPHNNAITKGRFEMQQAGRALDGFTEDGLIGKWAGSEGEL